MPKRFICPAGHGRCSQVWRLTYADETSAKKGLEGMNLLRKGMVSGIKEGQDNMNELAKKFPEMQVANQLFMRLMTNSLRFSANSAVLARSCTRSPQPFIQFRSINVVSTRPSMNAE